MLVQFHKDTLEPYHLIFSCDDVTREYYFSLGNVIHHPEHLGHHEIEIVPSTEIAHKLTKLETKTDFWFTVTGLPSGAEVFVNNQTISFSPGESLVMLRPVPAARPIDGVVHELAVADAPPDYLKIRVARTANGEEHLKTPFRPGDMFEIVQVENIPAVRRRQPMTLTAPATAKVGEEISISGVPEGVAISVNDSHIGIMDATGVLEFTAQTGGHYKFRCTGSGWITKEITVEALA